MEYRKIITLKDGAECVLRHAEEQDAQAVLDDFLLTREQTDFLATYPTRAAALTPSRSAAFWQTGRRARTPCS